MESTVITLFLFRSSKTFLHDDGLSYEQKRISNVVAATLFPKSLTSFQKPVVITHELPVVNTYALFTQ